MKKYLCTAIALTLAAPTAPAAFHEFEIQEIYSSGDGTVQFVELFTALNNQQFLSGHKIAFDIDLVETNVFNFTTNLPAGTMNKTFLVGTFNLTALYGVTPDYVIPANFFSQGALNFVDFENQTDKVSLASLPLDGVMSLDGRIDSDTFSTVSINSQATPTNFAGQTFMIPEPSSALLGAMGVAPFLIRRRRR